MAKAQKEDLVYVKELLETGRIRPIIDRSFPVTGVPEAIRYLEEEHAL